MITKNLEENLKKTKKKIIAEKAPTNKQFTQISMNMEKSLQEQDVSILFQTTFRPSFITKHADLTSNESFDIDQIFSVIYKHLNISNCEQLFVDSLFKIALQSHLIKVLTLKDLLRLRRKTYSCLLSYRIFTLLYATCIKLSIENDVKIKLRTIFNRVMSTFALPIQGVPAHYTLIEPYDSIVQTYFDQNMKNILTLQGQLFNGITIAMNSLQTYVEAALYTSSFIFNDFPKLLHLTIPNTRINNRRYETDLNIVSEVLFKEVPKKFLSKDAKQNKTITNFKSLLKVYGIFCIIQDLSQIKKPLNIVFPKISVSHLLKFTDSNTFSKSEFLSKNQYSALTQVIVEMSFDLQNHIALNFVPTTFIKNLENFDENHIKNIFDPFIKDYLKDIQSYHKERDEIIFKEESIKEKENS